MTKHALQHTARTAATTRMPEQPLQVVQFPCLDDNYGYLVHDPITGHTAAIDTPSGLAYRKQLRTQGWKLTHIFNTHHHHDHTAGNMTLKQASDDDNDVKIIGPAGERIPGIDTAVKAGDTVEFGGRTVQILDASGHTKGHIAFYFSQDSLLYIGDCLFSLGCGRMFEGTPEQFWNSLLGIRQLPDDTLMYW